MKIFLISTLCFTCILINAQDTIYKRSGDIVSTKILEVNIKDISYKRTDLLDGPLFIINKNDIKKVKYANGIIDSFAITKVIPPKQLVVRTPIYISEEIINPNKITSTYRRGIYQFQGRRISDRNVMFIAMKKNVGWKDPEININMHDYRRNKIIQYTIGLGGIFIGGVGVYGSAIAASGGSDNDAVTAGIAAIICSGILISSQIVSFQYKLKRLKNTNKVATLYNRLSGNE